MGHFPSDIDLSLITHINYAFFNIDIDNMNLTLSDTLQETENIHLFHYTNQTPLENKILPWSDNFNTEMGKIHAKNITSIGLIGQLNQMKEINPRLSISMSIGGENSSPYFERVANNKRGVDFFVSNTIDQMLYYGFDGIDIDWEFPDEEMTGSYLTYMMGSLRVALNAISTDCGSYSLSLAIPMDYETLKSYKLKELAQVIDHFHLMGYDESGPESTISCFHSPLYEDPNADLKNNINQTVHYLIENGISPEQIILGVPLYGHSFPVNKLYQPLGNQVNNCADIEGIEQSDADCVIEYKDIPLGEFTEVYDSAIGATYATRKTPPGLIVYDNVDSMNQKAQFVIDNNLGGTFWWDSNGDPWAENWERSLIKAFVDTVDGDLVSEICKVNKNSFNGALQHNGPVNKNMGDSMVVNLWGLLLGFFVIVLYI